MSVMITGASAGIGEACARAFAEVGRDLVLLARRLDRLEKLRDELGKKVKVHVFSVDVTNREQLDKTVQDPVFATVDVLVNNAGLARGRDPLQDGNPADWDLMFDTNVKAFLYVLHAVVPGMVERNAGHVVNLGSAAGHWNYPGGNVYAATKHAVRSLTESLRMDLHGKNIRVTGISPGMVETEFSEVRFGDAAKAKAVYQGFHPLHAQDIAEAVLWAVQRPAHVNIQDIVIFPTAQSSIASVARV